MPLAAITRAVSPTLNRCELSFLGRQPIEIARAIAQHRAYEDCLRALGVRVLPLAALAESPDAVFVEDPALVLEEIAVILRTGVESRRREAESLAAALAPFRPLRRIEAPGTLEGGDVVRIGRRLYVGRSARSNPEGAAQLAALTAEFGYTVHPVEMRGCLHLKSACTYLGRDTLLANRAWADAAAFGAGCIIDVAAGEEAAGDALAIGDAVILPSSFPQTAARLERAGFRVLPVDVSELQKAEAGVTCMSLVFEV